MCKTCSNARKREIKANDKYTVNPDALKQVKTESVDSDGFKIPETKNVLVVPRSIVSSTLEISLGIDPNPRINPGIPVNKTNNPAIC